ncbi:MAG: SCO family protein [Pseudomonadota bacterium]
MPVLLLILLLWSSPTAWAHEEAPPAPVAGTAPAALAPGVGVSEHLGQILPQGITLRDEQGADVDLRQLLSVPTILVPVFYSCSNACNLLLGTLSQVLPQVGLLPGRDYQVVTFSFDPTETPDLARQKHADFTLALGGKFPPRHWHFLTGDQADIQRLTEAIGFRYQRQGDGFQHPMVLVAVAPSGRITRYLYGGSPLAFDIALAATEAASDKPGLSVTRALAFCYTYDPQGRRYTFDLMRVAGASIIFALMIFGLFLAAGARKRRRKQAADQGQGDSHG